MKKKLSFLMVALVAVAAFAVQSTRRAAETFTYALAEGDTFTSGQTVTVNNGDLILATITYGEAGGNDFNAAAADAQVEGFTAFTSGNGTNGNKTGGTFYTIVPVFDGSIDVAVALNSGKAFYVEEDGTALADYNGFKVDAKYYGTYSFNVVAGKSYKIYCAGSKLGFYGFTCHYGSADAATLDFTAQGYENSAEVASLAVDPVLASFDKGTNSNAPKFYNSGNAVRLYAGNTMTVSTSQGGISKIAFTFGTGDKTNEITADKGTYADGVWTGKATSVTFTVGGTSGHRRIAKLDVTLGEAPAVADPAFSLASGTYAGTKSVELTCETEGAKIYYTVDGTEPTEASTEYTAAISVEATTTVKAIAVKGEDKSYPVSATYTIIKSIANTIDEPLTIAGAMFLIEETEAEVLAHADNQVYVKGIVAKVDEYNDKYKSITYWISDNGESNAMMQCYSGKGINGADFASIKDILPGAEVIVKGNLKKYTPKEGDPVYEFDYNNQLAKYDAPVIDITLEASDITNGDITAALNSKLDGYRAGNIYLTLDAATAYTITAPIEAGGNVVISGNKATVDASALTGAFIQMSKSPIVEANAKGAYIVDAVMINNLTIKGLPNSLFYDNKVKYGIAHFSIENTLIELNQTAVENESVIAFAAGGAKEFSIENSTVYGTNPAAKYFLRYNNNGRLDNLGYDKTTEIQKWTYLNNTFYNVLINGGQWGNGPNGQKYMQYEVENNIWYNCGKDIIRRLCNGRYSTELLSFVNNTYFNDGVDISASEANYDKSGTALTTDPEFQDAANGDFTIGIHTRQAWAKTGDSRWMVTFVPRDVTAQATPLEITVPQNLGVMDGNGGVTDLYSFTQNYQQDGNYLDGIKLVLEPGGEYTISKPLEIIGAISIEGASETNPATIDLSALDTNPFVKIDDFVTTSYVNGSNFNVNIHQVEFKNLSITNMKGQLFYANKQKYLIPYVTVDNCQIRIVGASKKTVFDFNGGGFVENLTVNNSTLSADDATTWQNGGFFSTQSGSKLEQAGAQQFTMTLTNNTFYNICKSVTPTSLRENSKEWMTFNVQNNIIVSCGKKGQFVRGLNAGQNQGMTSGKPIWSVINNSFQWTDSNIKYEDLAEDETINCSNCGVAACITGELVFSNYKEGIAVADFSLGICPQLVAKIGDPRWLKASKLEVYITPDMLDDDKDLAKAINQYAKEGFCKFLLQENARYDLKQSLVIDDVFELRGKNVVIDASENNDYLIRLSYTPGVELLNGTDYYGIERILLEGVTIKGIKSNILYDNNTKYCVVDMTINDCVLDLETEKVTNEALIAFEAGGIKDFTITNSTIYGNNSQAKYFVRYNNSARLDRYGYDKTTEFMTFTYLNNTFYGLLKSDGQWANYSAVAGQNYVKFDIEKNIWYNCGENIIRRLAGGRFGNNAPRVFYQNTYFNNNADNSAAEANYDNSGTALTSDPGFKNPANGDFTLNVYSQQADNQTGDPRWYLNGTYVGPTAIESIAADNAADLENATIYNLNGQRLQKTQKGLNIINGKKVVIK